MAPVRGLYERFLTRNRISKMGLKKLEKRNLWTNPMDFFHKLSAGFKAFQIPIERHLCAWNRFTLLQIRGTLYYQGPLDLPNFEGPQLLRPLLKNFNIHNLNYLLIDLQNDTIKTGGQKNFLPPTVRSYQILWLKWNIWSFWMEFFSCKLFWKLSFYLVY